jgi:hypothetical protein
MRIPKYPSLTLKQLIRGKAESFSRLLDQHRVRSYKICDYSSRALFIGLRALGIAEGDNVIVPAFICSVAVEPFRQYGIQVRYYRSGLDLTPHLEDIESLIDHRTKAIKVVHYFGFFNPGFNNIFDICEKHGLALIEDNAQGFLSSNEGELLGTRGTIGFSSLWKVLPIRNGAILYLNSSLVQSQDGVVYSPSGRIPHIKDIKFVLRSLLSSVEGKAACEPILRWDGWRNVADAGHRSGSFDYAAKNVGASLVSLWIADRVDFKEIINKRLLNYTFWKEQVTGTRIRAVFDSLPQGTCPFTFPAIAKDPNLLLETARRNAVSIYTWPKLPLEIVSSRRFAAEKELARRLIMLPVHQSVNMSYLEDRQFFRELFSTS